MESSMENKILYHEIRKLTVIILLISSIIAGIIFHDNFKSVTGGILVGGVTSLLGFNMIINMTNKINSDMNAHRFAYSNYLVRLLLYGCIFTLAVLSDMNIFAILFGYLSNKLAIYFYVYRNKEKEA